MRLLNIQTYKLRTFFGNKIPNYAILSHTWRSENDEEILFGDIQLPIEIWQNKPSFPKVRGFFEAAAANAYQWVWIDTCCIDKSSSAELSEAINTMYMWYKEAGACYVYLEDVEFKSTPLENLQSLKSSRWFTRGWTLQELLAPETVEFYDKNWRELGTKKSLQGTITELTGIRREILIRLEDMLGCTIAERMSWAANRNTTREEDIAYCLLGIFDIYMPLQYGEGKKAFQRLQEEILKVTEDYTWLAWKIRPPKHYSVFATSPSCFAGRLEQSGCSQSSPFETIFIKDTLQTPIPWSNQQPISAISWNYSQLELVNSINLGMTKSLAKSLLIEEKRLTLNEFPRLTPRGLHLTLPILEHKYHGTVAFLHCICRPAGELVCLALCKEPFGSEDNYYSRADKGVVLLSDNDFSVQYKTIYFKTTANLYDSLRETSGLYRISRAHSKQTIVLTTGLEISSVLLLHLRMRYNIAYHFVLRYETMHFHLLFGLQGGSWCYLTLAQDHEPLTKRTGSLKELIAKSIIGQESDRAELGIKGVIVYCTIKKRKSDWMHFQASRYSPEQFKEVEDSVDLYSVDVWALPGSTEQLQIIDQEQIEGSVLGIYEGHNE